MPTDEIEYNLLLGDFINDNNLIIKINGNKTSAEIRNEIFQEWHTISLTDLVDPTAIADRSISIIITNNERTTVFPSFTETQKIRYPDFFDRVNRIEIKDATKMNNINYLNVFKNLEFFSLKYVNKIKELPDFFYTDLKHKLKYLFLSSSNEFGLFFLSEKIKDIELIQLSFNKMKINGSSHISNISTLEKLRIGTSQPSYAPPLQLTGIDFSKLTNLNHIYLSAAIRQMVPIFSADQIQKIKKLPNLISIEISGIDDFISGQFIEGDLPKLESLA